MSIAILVLTCLIRKSKVVFGVEFGVFLDYFEKKKLTIKSRNGYALKSLRED